MTMSYKNDWFTETTGHKEEYVHGTKRTYGFSATDDYKLAASFALTGGIDIAIKGGVGIAIFAGLGIDIAAGPKISIAPVAVKKKVLHIGSHTLKLKQLGIDLSIAGLHLKG